MDKWVCWLALLWHQHTLIPLFTLASLCQVEPGAVSTLVLTLTRSSLCPYANV